MVTRTAPVLVDHWLTDVVVRPLGTMTQQHKSQWQCTASERLAAEVRDHTQAPWTQVKRWIQMGKVAVNGQPVTDPGHVLRAHDALALDLAAPRPIDPKREGALAYDDAHVVVIDKPSGVSSVPYDARETHTAMDMIRAAWRRKPPARSAKGVTAKGATEIPLHVVHRIDKATSGLLAFAKTKRAELGLGAQFRAHSISRHYLCLVHGMAQSKRIESYLVADRGDGLRGSTRYLDQGKRAVTHVTAMAHGKDVTLCAVRLETGKTHQIRIHMAEDGHPLLGEEVYIRTWRKHEHLEYAAPRLMLHAASLGFDHPVTGARVELQSELPADFVATARRYGIQLPA